MIRIRSIETLVKEKSSSKGYMRKPLIRITQCRFLLLTTPAELSLYIVFFFVLLSLFSSLLLISYTLGFIAVVLRVYLLSVNKIKYKRSIDTNRNLYWRSLPLGHFHLAKVKRKSQSHWPATGYCYFCYIDLSELMCHKKLLNSF